MTDILFKNMGDDHMELFLAFIGGLLLGVVLGVILMCVIQINGKK
jgi:NhaP-type Na+/H+ or K+/H+ antiporter